MTNTNTTTGTTTATTTGTLAPGETGWGRVVAHLNTLLAGEALTLGPAEVLLCRGADRRDLALVVTFPRLEVLVEPGEHGVPHLRLGKPAPAAEGTGARTLTAAPAVTRTLE